MNPLTSTLADLTAAKLVAFAASAMPPRPPATVQGSTDPAVFRTDSYIKALNLQAYEGSVYGAVDVYGGMRGSNQGKLDSFSGMCHEWEQHGKVRSAIPAFPNFDEVNVAKFDSWWDRFNATIGQGAPAVDFIVPADPIPAVVIVDPAAPAPTSPTAGPIGMAKGAGYFDSSPSDNFPAGFVYPDVNGIPCMKYVYSDPFTNGLKSYWKELGA